MDDGTTLCSMGSSAVELSLAVITVGGIDNNSSGGFVGIGGGMPLVCGGTVGTGKCTGLSSGGGIVRGIGFVGTGTEGGTADAGTGGGPDAGTEGGPDAGTGGGPDAGIEGSSREGIGGGAEVIVLRPQTLVATPCLQLHPE